MPEGHTLRIAASRLAPLVGRTVSVETPQPRHRLAAMDRALDGRVLEDVSARGKHLLLRFAGGRILHSHLRMTGAWDVYAAGARWRKSPRAAWIVLRAGDHVAVEYSGPVLELLDDARLRVHPVLSRLGPDVLDAGFDPQAAVARIRRGVGGEASAIADLLLDQRIACGIGNVYKCEALWACGVDPWAPSRTLADDLIARLYAEASRQMAACVAAGRELRHRIYGQPRCERCGGPVSRRAQGDDGRPTFWCPQCQPRAAAPVFA